MTISSMTTIKFTVGIQMENICHSDPQAAVCLSVLHWNKNCYVQKRPVVLTLKKKKTHKKNPLI